MSKKNIRNDEKTYEMISYLLYAYNTTQDAKVKKNAKALIVTKMLPIIKRIAHTIARRSYDPIDDLVQAGSIGLIKAIDNYSRKRSENFRVYAGCLIIGEMKHYLRDLACAIKVPSYVQELSFRINSFMDTLTVEELKNLTNEEVAEVLNVPEETINFVMQNDRRGKIISLENINNNSNNSSNLSFEEVLSDELTYDKNSLKDSKIIVNSLLIRLPLLYKQIIELYYFKGFTQKDIAAELNLSRMQVSRRLKKAFMLMCNMVQFSEMDTIIINDDIEIEEVVED